MKILATLLELSKDLCMEGYRADYVLELSDGDFERFVYAFEKEYKHLVVYPDLQSRNTLKDLKTIKIAGPGNYLHVKRKSAEKDSD